MPDRLNKIKIETDKYSYADHHLGNLASMLNYELSAGTLFLLSFFSGIFLALASLAGILFIPYLLYVLHLEKKYAWIFTFNLLIIFPILIVVFFFKVFLIPAITVSLAVFYLYCFILRISVNNWIRNKNWKRQLMNDMMDEESADSY